MVPLKSYSQRSTAVYFSLKLPSGPRPSDVKDTKRLFLVEVTVLCDGVPQNVPSSRAVLSTPSNTSTLSCLQPELNGILNLNSSNLITCKQLRHKHTLVYSVSLPGSTVEIM